MEIQLQQTISEEDIASLIVTALEGGSNYWYCLNGITKYLGTDKQIKQADGQYWVLLEERLKEGNLSLPVYDLEDPDTQLGTLTNESIVKALQTMSTDYPIHYKDFVTENYDASTGDVFFQLAVMGDVTFC